MSQPLDQSLFAGPGGKPETVEEKAAREEAARKKKEQEEAADADAAANNAGAPTTAPNVEEESGEFVAKQKNAPAQRRMKLYWPEARHETMWGAFLGQLFLLLLNYSFPRFLIPLRHILEPPIKGLFASVFVAGNLALGYGSKLVGAGEYSKRAFERADDYANAGTRNLKLCAIPLWSVGWAAAKPFALLTRPIRWATGTKFGASFDQGVTDLGTGIRNLSKEQNRYIGITSTKAALEYLNGEDPSNVDLIEYLERGSVGVTNKKKPDPGEAPPEGRHGIGGRLVDGEPTKVVPMSPGSGGGQPGELPTVPPSKLPGGGQPGELPTVPPQVNLELQTQLSGLTEKAKSGGTNPELKRRHSSPELRSKSFHQRSASMSRQNLTGTFAAASKAAPAPTQAVPVPTKIRAPQ